MSRYYDCFIETKNNIQPEEQEIVDEYIGETWLTGGEAEWEYTDRIAKEIWKKVGRYIYLNIRMTYLEDLPYENYEFDNERYNEMKEDDEL